MKKPKRKEIEVVPDNIISLAEINPDKLYAGQGHWAVEKYNHALRVKAFNSGIEFVDGPEDNDIQLEQVPF